VNRRQMYSWFSYFCILISLISVSLILLLVNDLLSIFLTAIKVPVFICLASYTSPYDPFPRFASFDWTNSKSFLVILAIIFSIFYYSGVNRLSSFPSLIKGVLASIRYTSFISTESLASGFYPVHSN